jgi:hypothetical protein
MMFQRYILVVLAFALCLVATTPAFPSVNSAVQSRDGAATPTANQAARQEPLYLMLKHASIHVSNNH